MLLIIITMSPDDKIGLSKLQDKIKFEKLCGTNVRVKINTYLGISVCLNSKLIKFGGPTFILTSGLVSRGLNTDFTFIWKL